MAAEDVFDQLLEVSLLLQADLDQTMRELDLTVSKTQLLWEVHQHGPCSQQRLAEAIGVSPRHVTSLVDALSDRRLVHRSPHPQDRRAFLVELTAEGVDLMATMEEQRRRDARLLVEGLNAGEVDALSTNLELVLVRLRRLVEAARTRGEDPA